VNIFDDLTAEQDRLAAILAELSPGDWAAGSGAAGWTVRDVVVHLAQSEEAVAATTAIAGQGSALGGSGSTIEPGAMDRIMDELVRADDAPPGEVLARWQAARRASVAALRAADPDARFAWAATPLKPATLATTRLAEHWAHGLDITGPLGIPLPDTDRLRHIAWLAHSTLPYAFKFAGHDPHPVYCELTAPDATTVWRFGPQDAPSTITGDAGAFCRVGAQRLPADSSGLTATGPHGAQALSLLRNYAA